MFSITNKVRFMSVTTIFVMLFSLMSISPVVAAGAPGSLDTTFGTDGKAIVDFGGDEDNPTMALDQAGRILLVGFAGSYPDYDFGIARLNPDGTPDTTFGSDGYTTVDFGGTDMGYAIASDALGRIIIAGLTNIHTPNIGWSSVMTVARLNSDGTLDSTFGDGGKVTIGFDGRRDIGAYAMSIDEAGQIVLAGSSSKFLYSTEDGDIYSIDMAVVRLNPNGFLDTTFGQDGLVEVDFGNEDIAFAMALDHSGNIIVTGQTSVYTDTLPIANMAVARLNEHGVLDTSFGDNGRSIIDMGGYELAASVAVDDSGRIVLTGLAAENDFSNSDFGVARLNSDGTPDSTFGAGGQTKVDFGGFDISTGIKLDGAGNIIVGGHVDGDSSDFAVAQLHNDGTLDAGFDEDGLATVDFGGYDYANSLVLDGAGHILVVGATDVSGTYDFALARLNASPTTVPMSIQGFYSPVDMNGVWNTVKGGATVPLQFEVFDGEDEITDVSVIDQPLQATQALCDGGPSDTVEVVSTGGTSLRYDETLGQFVYNWKTPKKPGYCYVVTVTLEDGTSLSANFKLK